MKTKAPKAPKAVSNLSVSAILPDAMYPYAAWQRVSGCGAGKIREGRLADIPLPTVNVGRRKYVVGRDGIAWLIAMSKLSASRRPAN